MAGFFGRDVPFLEYVGIQGEHWEAGTSVVSLAARPEINNYYGGAHGGAVATLLDVSMAAAARSLHPEHGVITVSMTVNYLRIGEGPLRGHGKAQQAGRSLVFCEAEVVDEQGRVVATAMGTFKIRRTSSDA